MNQQIIYDLKCQLASEMLKHDCRLHLLCIADLDEKLRAQRKACDEHCGQWEMEAANLRGKVTALQIENALLQQQLADLKSKK